MQMQMQCKKKTKDRTRQPFLVRAHTTHTLQHAGVSLRFFEPLYRTMAYRLPGDILPIMSGVCQKNFYLPYDTMFYSHLAGWMAGWLGTRKKKKESIIGLLLL